MKLWTIAEFFVGLIILYVFIHAVRGYVPEQLMFIVRFFDVVYDTLSALFILLIDAVIAVLRIMRDLLPRGA